jgi:hypothetical protein
MQRRELEPMLEIYKALWPTSGKAAIMRQRGGARLVDLEGAKKIRKRGGIQKKRDNS